MSVTNNIPTISNPNGAFGYPATATGEVVSPTTQAIVGPSNTGAISPVRFMGGTASGAPVTGTFNSGDYVVDLQGNAWICLFGGSPGAWVQFQPSNTLGIYGDGFGGTITLGGGTTTGSVDTTYDALIVPSGATLNAHGYRIVARTYIWIQAGGKIQNNGAAGSNAGTVGTVTANIGTLTSGTAGAAGTTTGGNNSTNTSNSYGGSGGAGGAGASGSGGAQRTATIPADGSIHHLPNCVLGAIPSLSGTTTVWNLIQGGAGGAGGGGDTSVKGGAGGNGGGILILCAPLIIIEGIASAVGGSGGSPATGNSGGGGGGGGGTIILIYDRLTFVAGGARVYGGTGGVATGTGVNGNNGNDGSVIRIRNRTPFLYAGEVNIPFVKVGLTPSTSEPDHRAFGNVAKLSNNDLFVTFRTGNQHGPASPGGAGTDQGVLSFVKTSDNGLTFTSPANYYTDGTYNCQDNCSMVTSAGTLITSFFMTQTDGTNLVNGCRVIRSTDNGTTFDTPRALNDTLSTKSLLSSPAIQLSTGRLIQAVYGITSGIDHNICQAVYSDDDGKTWAYLSTLTDSGAQMTEPNLVYESDNEIVAFIRQTGDDSLGRLVSRNGGLTWSTVTTVIAGTPYSAHASPRTTRMSNGIYVQLNRVTDQLGSSRAALYISQDKGVTWTGPFSVDQTQYNEMVYGGSVEYDTGKLLLSYFLEGTQGQHVQYLDAQGFAKRLIVGPA